MLSRVWVERAGSESAVFGGARPLSDLVDMPIDTCICLWICCAMLRYACAWLPFSLSVLRALPLCLSPSVSSCVASLFLHLAHLSSGYSGLLCPLFFSFPRNLPRLAPSRFRPQLLSSPSASLSLPTTVLFLFLSRAGDGVLVGERDSGGNGCGGSCAPMLAWWGCGGGGR